MGTELKIDRSEAAAYIQMPQGRPTEALTSTDNFEFYTGLYDGRNSGSDFAQRCEAQFAFVYAQSFRGVPVIDTSSYRGLRRVRNYIPRYVGRSAGMQFDKTGLEAIGKLIRSVLSGQSAPNVVLKSPQISVVREDVTNTSAHDRAIVPVQKPTSNSAIEKLNIKFRPSDELMLAWMEAQNALFQEAGNTPLRREEVLANPDYAFELTIQLRKIISHFAARKAYTERKYLITFGGVLLPSLQTIIADHLFLPPMQAATFIKTLTKDIYTQSRVEPAFSGDWGRLTIDHKGELLLELTKRRRQSLASLLKG